MVDPKTAIHVETFDDKISVTPMDNRYICTNHFRSIDWGAKTPKEYQNSFDRFSYAEEKINLFQKQEDLLAAISPRNSADRERIWRADSFQTISSTVLNLNEKAIYRCSGAGEDFDKVIF